MNCGLFSNNLVGLIIQGLGCNTWIEKDCEKEVFRQYKNEGLIVFVKAEHDGLPNHQLQNIWH